jgi:hypothetical protein
MQFHAVVSELDPGDAAVALLFCHADELILSASLLLQSQKSRKFFYQRLC